MTDTKKRIFRVCLICLGVGAAGLAYLLIYRALGVGIPCIFHEITGLLCPGCGITRAVDALFRADLVGALRFNQMIFVYLAYMLWFALTAAVRYIKGKRDPLLFGPNWLHISVGACAIIFCVWRNISHLL